MVSLERKEGRKTSAQLAEMQTLSAGQPKLSQTRLRRKFIMPAGVLQQKT